MRKNNFNLKKKFLALILSVTMMFANAPMTYAMINDKPKLKASSTTSDQLKSNINSDDVNIALDKAVTAYRAPRSYWGPEKATDGIVNRSANKPQQSRWSSEVGAPGWIMIDLKEPQTFDRITIEWEKQVVENYHIQISDDGKNFSTIYTSPKNVEGFEISNKLKFDTPIKGRYVKLCIDKLTEGSYPSVSVYEIEVLTSAKVNKALGKKATASKTEWVYTPQKAVDGIINRDVAHKNQQSRWSSGAAGGSWLCVDLGRPLRFNNFVANWETITGVVIRDYHVEISNNQSDWETIYSTPADRIPALREDVILDDNYTARYVKIVADKVQKYPSVSLYEFEIYENLDFLSIKDFAKDLKLSPINANDKSLKLPTSTADVDISLVGADYEQIIKPDLSISKPLVDKDVLVSFEVTSKTSDKKALSPEFNVKVPGRYNINDSINKKPKVIPELQEWFGHKGDFTTTDSSKIVVDTLCGSEYMDIADIFAEDYEDVTGISIDVVEGTKADVDDSDFYFSLSKETLGKETYCMDIGNSITISSSEPTGSYWATRTILQILKQNETTIPKGIIRDYPKFKVRGVMLDVGRLPVPLYFLKEWTKTMSWYKMNDFQVHLNDVSSAGDYNGFRLESDVPNLSNDDLIYSKTDFRDFMKFAKEIGVNIVPEFDSPGHAGAFTRARPDLARKDKKKYLDVQNPESLKFIKSVFDEYMQKNNPVFLDDSIIHIGTDEYKGGGQADKEAFRVYQDELLKYVRDEKGHTPRVWGSQTENSGDTPITVDGVQMNLWYKGYANPEAMFNLGYDLININDADVYIVPGAGYYHDYLNKNHIYNRWEPNVVAGYHIPASNPQMLGGAYALWNDKSGPTNDIGVSEAEMFDRLYDIVPMFAAKTWGDGQDYTLKEIENLASITNYAPNSNPTHIVKTKEDNILSLGFDKSDPNVDASANKYNLIEQVNVSFEKGYIGNALTLKGDSSYVKTPINDLKFGSTLDFWIKKDGASSEEEQILFESEIGAIKAVQKETGKFGFSRDLRDYSFNYVLPDDVWTHITIVTEYTKTSLYVNGIKVDELGRKKTGEKFATLIMPLSKIGSSTNSFEGQIDQINVYNSIIDIEATNSKDKCALSDAIKKAEDLIKNALVNAGEEKCLQSKLDKLVQAIDIAKLTLANINSTSEEYVSAKLALEIAVNNYSSMQLKEQTLQDACHQIATEIGKITATNDTTAENILAIAKEVITNKDIQINWSEEINITEATKDKEGCILGKIELTLNESVGEIEVDLVIPQLTEISEIQTIEQAVAAVESKIKEATVTNEITGENIMAFAEKAITNEKIQVNWSEELEITEATEANDGSIRGKIKLTLNENVGEVEVDLAIPKLVDINPETQTLEQAVPAVELEIEKITVTNEKTAESVLDIAKEAISNKEIQMAWSEELEITKATEANDGSIRGKIMLTLNENADEVEVDLTIPQLVEKAPEEQTVEQTTTTEESQNEKVDEESILGSQQKETPNVEKNQ